MKNLDIELNEDLRSKSGKVRHDLQEILGQGGKKKERKILYEERISIEFTEITTFGFKDLEGQIGKTTCMVMMIKKFRKTSILTRGTVFMGHKIQC